MFAAGFSPAGAHAEKKVRLKETYPEDWHVRFSDRSILPSIFWVYYWHRKWMDSNIGSRDGIDCYLKAMKMIDEYNERCNDDSVVEKECFAKIAQTDSS